MHLSMMVLEVLQCEFCFKHLPMVLTSISLPGEFLAWAALPVFLIDSLYPCFSLL